MVSDAGQYIPSSRVLYGREFHEFDAGVVGIVEIELPFAATADLRFFARLPTVLEKLVHRGFDVRDTKAM